MCTVLFGWNALEPGTLLLAANRDEDPARAATGPRVLRHAPRVVGGLDRVAGGTWLAIRERRALVAVLNRRGPDANGPAPRRPSRGWLALTIAAAGDGHPGRMAEAARRLLDADAYAPCSLLVAGPEGAWVVSHLGAGPARLAPVAAGWHVLTHAELDDPAEPRAAWLARELRGFRPRSPDEAEQQLSAWLAAHGSDTPPVCLHDGRMRTVSTSRVWLSRSGAHYRHGEGPACTASITDHSSLLTPSHEDSR